jgi:hypothetical protein
MDEGKNGEAKTRIAGLCGIAHGNTLGGNPLLELFFQHRLAGGGGIKGV